MQSSFFIPWNTPSSKNGKIISRWNGLIISEVTQQWVKAAEPFFREYREAFLAVLAEHKPPYIISFKFIRKSKHQFDYVNPLQTVQDMMTGGFGMCFGTKKKPESEEHRLARTWLSDDNADILRPIPEPYEYDKNNPGVWITVHSGCQLF